MRKILCLVAVLMLVMVSCKKPELLFISYHTSNVKVVFQQDVDSYDIAAGQLTFVNITTGSRTSVSCGSDVELLEGYYDCYYESTAKMGEFSTKVQGLASGVIIKADATFNIDIYLLPQSSDFIISEIFFAGTLQPSGKQYRGDNYMIITNPTNNVLYADGIALCETKFVSTNMYEYSPDIRSDTVSVQAIYVIPGSGTEHPVEPGKSLVLCDIGIDHRTSNPNSIDLSHADFEWYDESTVASVVDIDSETVPNLDKWYCYTASIWQFHNRGFRSYVIARIPVAKDEYLANYMYEYSYVMHLAAGDFPMTQKAYKIANSWVVDGVNLSVESEHVWNVLPPSIDAGWTHCGSVNSDKNRYGKSVRRKSLIDTNNSTNDFYADALPSLF